MRLGRIIAKLVVRQIMSVNIAIAILDLIKTVLLTRHGVQPDHDARVGKRGGQMGEGSEARANG